MIRYYATLIIDIKKSRSYSDLERDKAQSKLLKIIDYINYVLENIIVQKLKFASGDSIQGLFETIEDALLSFFLIRNLFYPYSIRCGIGYETVNDYILNKNYNDSNLLDGKAYHLAVMALEKCKKEDNSIIINSKSKRNDIIINQLLHSSNLLNNTHTEKQVKIFKIFNLLYPIKSYKDYKTNIFKTLKEIIIDYSLNQNVKDDYIKFLIDDLFIYEDDLISTITSDSIFPTKLNKKIADLLNVKRQYISKIRSSGIFDEIRKLELCAILFAKQNYEEKIYDSIITPD